MDVKTLCSVLSLPVEVTEKLEACVPCADAVLLNRLCCPKHAEEAYRSIALQLGEDHMTMLLWQLQAACRTHQRYLEKGIPESVFADTMGCYRRFLLEAYRMYDLWKFDRAWWTWRQLSMRLFRIGQLEFEILYEKRVISVHIPSDAVLSDEAVSQSLKSAKAFFREYYPMCGNWLMVCDSWLLSPELKKLLKPESNILRFQKRFLLLSRHASAKDHMQWLFWTEEDASLEKLPENTALQRNAKKHLLSGGKIGTALGVLIKL